MYLWLPVAVCVLYSFVCLWWNLSNQDTIGLCVLIKSGRQKAPVCQGVLISKAYIDCIVVDWPGVISVYSSSNGICREESGCRGTRHLAATLCQLYQAMPVCLPLLPRGNGSVLFL